MFALSKMAVTQAREEGGGGERGLCLGLLFTPVGVSWL